MGYRRSNRWARLHWWWKIVLWDMGRRRICLAVRKVPGTRILVAEHDHCPLTWVKCGTGKVELGHRTNPRANGCWMGLPEEYPGSRFFTGRKDVKIFHRECLEVTYNNGRTNSVRKDIKERSNSGKSLLQLPMDSREGSIVSLSHLSIARCASAVIFFGWRCTAGSVKVAIAKVSKFQPFRPVLYPIRGNTASFCMLNLARSRKSLISAYYRFCGARIGIIFALDIQSPRKDWSDLPFRWNQVFTRGWYKLKWFKWVAKIVKNPLGCLASEGSPMAVVPSLNVVYLFSTPNLSWFWSQYKDIFSTEDLVFLPRPSTNDILLPHDFFFEWSFWQ